MCTCYILLYGTAIITWYQVRDSGKAMRCVFTSVFWGKVIVPGVAGEVLRDCCGDPRSRLRYGMMRREDWARRSPTAHTLVHSRPDSLTAYSHSLTPAQYHYYNNFCVLFRPDGRILIEASQARDCSLSIRQPRGHITTNYISYLFFFIRPQYLFNPGDTVILSPPTGSKNIVVAVCRRFNSYEVDTLGSTRPPFCRMRSHRQLCPLSMLPVW